MFCSEGCKKEIGVFCIWTQLIYDPDLSINPANKALKRRNKKRKIGTWSLLNSYSRFLR